MCHYGVYCGNLLLSLTRIFITQDVQSCSSIDRRSCIFYGYMKYSNDGYDWQIIIMAEKCYIKQEKRLSPSWLTLFTTNLGTLEPRRQAQYLFSTFGSDKQYRASVGQLIPWKR